MLTISPRARIYVCREATDMRRSFEGLSYLVQERLEEEPLSGHVFVFFNRQRDRVKILY